MKGLLLGAFKKPESDEVTLTTAAESFDKQTSGKFKELLKQLGPFSKKVKCRVLYQLDKKYDCVAIVDLGPQDAGYNELEEVEEKRENIRCAVAGGVKQLRDAGAVEIDIDACDDPECAAEGSSLVLFSYDDLKKDSAKKPKVKLSFCSNERVNEWEKGMIKGEGQNFARYLMETPANFMTPTVFAQKVTEKLSQVGVTVITRDKSWAEEKKMGSFLSVARGSDEPPVFVEITYNGRDETTKPLALVGKGITFDSGGISIKPSASMDKMRGDMGGAACVAASIYILAALKVPVNVKGFIPLTENLPSGKATKPGDVVFAMNGKSIQVDNTDAEGRLVLADALCYAQTFDPVAILDMATLTGAMDVALGSSATGVFTNSAMMWQMIHFAGMRTGDRMWRMPLFRHYSKQVTDSVLADVNNIGKAGRQGGACTAAAFLKEFVTHNQWLHLDIAGVMETKDEVPYLSKGMSGRPTRTIVEFATKLASQGW